jgi:hypothetical protein
MERQIQRMEDVIYRNFAYLPEENAQVDQVNNGNKAVTSPKA